MKRIVIIITGLILIFIATSCKKEEIQSPKSSDNELSLYLKANLPPVRWFECGEQTVPPSPYPCPNASCPYMGWDCAFEVDINEWDQDDYYDAADLLEYYIDEKNTKYFFSNYLDEVELLAAELIDPLREPMLDDLQDGTTSVLMHPYYNSKLEEELYYIQIYVVSTGEPPDYGDE